MASLMSDLYLATTNAAPLELNAADLDNLNRGHGEEFENGTAVETCIQLQNKTAINLAVRNSISLLYYPLTSKWLLLGSLLFIDPYLSQQRAGLQHTVFQLQPEITNPNACFM